MMDCFFRTKNLRPLRRVWATSNAMISFVCTDPALHAETSARPLVRLVGSIACPRRLGLALVTGADQLNGSSRSLLVASKEKGFY
jgi:hypothetical protein